MSRETIPNLNNALGVLERNMGTLINKPCLKSARDKAFLRVKEMGVPSGKDEYWKFISPDRFFDPRLNKSNEFSSKINNNERNSDFARIFFVDGKLDKSASELVGFADIEILQMNQKTGSTEMWVEDLYGKLEEKSQEKRANSLAAFNTASASDGIFIRVKSSNNRKLEINYIGTSSSSDSVVHNLIRLEAGASLTLVERGAGSYRTSRLFEIELLEKSRLNHLRFFEDCADSHILSQLFVRQAYKSVYKEFTVSFFNSFLRNEIWVSLEGEDSIVSLSGASVGAKDDRQDDTVYVEHLSENCQSRQVFKKVLSDTSVGAFQGKIFVSSDAQKTDGYQISKGLLLDNNSKFLVKPELEIYADDVACSHGSTSGALDEESLFYFMSRGVSKEEAAKMLMVAFLDEAIQEIENNELANDVRSVVTDKLEIQFD